MEITVGKFYERIRGDGSCWTVTPIHITKNIVTFRDLQQFDRGPHTCSKRYFRDTFTAINEE